MKVLHIVRHAEANGPKKEQTDFDRTLTEKGEKTARASARRLRKAGFVADHMITSPAPRAKGTARAFAKTMKFSLKKIQEEPVIYEGADNASLLALVRGLPAKADDALIFGHDPSFTGLARHLAANFDHAMPKCSVVTIGFDTENWADAGPNNASLLRFDYPLTKRDRDRLIENEIQSLSGSLSVAMAKHLLGMDPRTAEKLRRYVFKYHSMKKMRKIARRFVELSPKHEAKNK